jgi:hypothetical protein
MCCLAHLPRNVQLAAELINSEIQRTQRHIDVLHMRLAANPDDDAAARQLRLRTLALASHNDLLQLLGAPIVRLIAWEQARARQAAAAARMVAMNL